MLIAQFVVIQTIVFLIVFVLLRRLMIQNTMSAVNRLKAADEENARRLEEMKKKIEEAQAEYERKSAELAAALERERAEAMQRMVAERDALLGAARAEGERTIAAAKERAAELARGSEKELQAKVTAMAGRLVRDVLDRQLMAALNDQLVDGLLQEMETLDIGQVPAKATAADVVLPYPLSADARRRIERLLEKKIGRKIALRETIKDDMCGGLILRLDSLVMDGSLENRLETAIRAIRKQT